MAAIDTNGNEKNWFDGNTYRGIRNHVAKTGKEKNWFDGMPMEELIPLDNQDTGVQFFMFFD